MLAQSYDKYGHKIEFPCYGQPKLDGLRCLATKDGLYSRQGKKFRVLEHIESALERVFQYHPAAILDGELYSHEIDFQSIISGTKRDESNDLTQKIEYHIYDIVDRSKPFSVRINNLHIMLLNSLSCIVHVDTFMIHTKESVAEIHNEVVNDGYEGIMLRNAHGLYTPDKRSYDLQKVKSFNDEEFEIVGMRADKNNQAVFTCITKDGTEFDVKPQGDDESRKAYLNRKDLIGKMLTVKFFDYTTSDNPVPRFPVGIVVRDYE
jgi:DNA ligase-1